MIHQESISSSENLGDCFVGLRVEGAAVGAEGKVKDGSGESGIEGNTRDAKESGGAGPWSAGIVSELIEETVGTSSVVLAKVEKMSNKNSLDPELMSPKLHVGPRRVGLMRSSPKQELPGLTECCSTRSLG